MVKSIENKLCFDEMYDLSITDFRKRIYTLGYHAKKAVNRFGKFVKREGIAAVLLGAMTVASCKLPGPDPVPPTPPTSPIDFTKVNSDLSNLNEYNSFSDKPYSITETLPLTDTNANPVTYASVNGTSSDGKVNYNLNGNILQVTANQGNTGKFQIPITYKDNGQSGSTTLDGYLYNLLDVSGQLQDNESQTNKAGALVVLDSNGNPLTNSPTVTTNGNFSFKVDKRADQKFPLTSVVIEAGAGNYVLANNNTDGSYIRKVQLNNLTGDVTSLTDSRMNPAIRVVPYTWLIGGQIADFITHMGRVNFWSDAERLAAGITGGVTGNPFNGLKKWNFGELPDDINHPIFQGIEVSSNDFPGGTGTGTYYDNIAKIVHSSSFYPNANNIRIEYGELHNGQNGWGRIILGTGSPYTIMWDQNGSDGYLEGFKTYLTLNQTSDYNIVRHEVLGHGLNFPGHADGVPITGLINTALFNSIMRYTGYDIRYNTFPISSPYGATAPTDFTSTDTKGYYITHESTYLGMESEDKILGTTF